MSLAERIASLSEAQKQELAALLGEASKRKRQRKLFTMYPEEGPHRRELYPKHLEFFEAGKDHKERTFLAANRVGKTVGGAFETTCHITGRYPDWWEGYRFDRPVKFWAAGDTAKTVRDIIQVELLGIAGEHGTGMIPGEDILRTTPKAGVPDAVDTIYVKHYNARGEQDGISQLGLKSYDQGRIAFQGTAQDGIWLDEECPMEVYMECLVRTMTTKGIIYLTFTPLKGLTDVVLLFMPKGEVLS
jgi:phage terminase large subunit-like protein